MQYESLAYHGGMENFWLTAAWSILPTLAVCTVFYFVIRSILRFDRTERRVHARIEAEERAARGLPPRV
ncbi:hypothetical protein RS84_01957 [Microbacterium hydrocarbonoxydans]|uniref:Heme exporter protein D n=2 Tax=Microbacterium hydrocarbonoxydans TaxID=273678 RepID=A0A0M2HRQ3_9MICO|nr:hypothetical protein RS84_01957 [Microbacterium hydrocarbonoxydans]